MSDLTDEEIEYTREFNTRDIRNKNINDCDYKELKIRCLFNEQYIKLLEEKLKNKKGRNER